MSKQRGEIQHHALGDCFECEACAVRGCPRVRSGGGWAMFNKRYQHGATSVTTKTTTSILDGASSLKKQTRAYLLYTYIRHIHACIHTYTHA